MIEDTAMETRDSWYHTPSSAEQVLGAWPVTAGTSKAKLGCRNSGSTPLTFFSLQMVLRGSVRFRLNDTWALLGPGDLFCVFPEANYEYGACPDRELPYRTWLAIDGPAAGDLVAQLGLSINQPTIQGLSAHRFTMISRRLGQTFGRPLSRRSLSPIEYLASFVGEVLEQVSSRSHAPDHSRDWLRQGQHLIDTRFTEPITITGIADELGVERSQFTKAFHRHVGVTPAAYLTRLRMEHARELLAGDSELSVTATAHAVGYQDVYTFSRAFRRHFGAPPTAYR